MLRKIFQPFYTAFVIATFVISVLFAFPVFLVLSIGNNSAARRSIFLIVKYWSKAWLWVIGMPVTVLGKKPPEERYVIVANHISYIDTVVIFSAVPGYFRPLGKKEISRIPIIGFIYKQIVIMVDRSDIYSRARSMKLLWRVLHRDGNILIFPEGTFNETDEPLKSFYDGAFRLAINTQKSILPIIFPDTVYRWHYSAWWKLWPGKNRAVYLPPVDVTSLKAENLPELKERVFNLMKEELEKYPYPLKNATTKTKGNPPL